MRYVETNIPLSYRQLIMLTLFILGFSVAFIAYGVISGSFTTNNVGYIKTVRVGVYSDVECTKEVDFLDWGYFQPGESKNFTVYVKNNGTVPMILSHNVQNWAPPSCRKLHYVQLGWRGKNRGERPCNSSNSHITCGRKHHRHRKFLLRISDNWK